MKSPTLIIVAFMVFAPGSVPATIINVPHEYSSIQEGIDASSDGDTVLVQPGFYRENITFGSHNVVLGSLFLTSDSIEYISSTIISAGSVGSAIAIPYSEDTTTAVIGFTVQDGHHGAIYCNSSRPRIHNNILADNEKTDWTHENRGAAIFCYNSPASIRNNIIINNRVESSGITDRASGGAIYCILSDASIVNNIIMWNQAHSAWWKGSGGGISCVGSSPEIRSNIIAANQATGRYPRGGGIDCGSGSDPIIANNIITANEAIGYSFTYGGGIFCRNVSNPLIINNVIFGNSTLSDLDNDCGGGIGIYDSEPILLNNIFWNNSATAWNEIYLENASPRIAYCDIEGGWEGEGNIDIDPLFRDPDNDDYHLMTTGCGDPLDSPCIDTGDPIILDDILDCDRGLGNERSDIGAYGGASIECIYIPGDCDNNGVPLEIDDIVAMISYYRGNVQLGFSCYCSGYSTEGILAATADPNGNCVPNELSDVITEIGAYRGSTTVSGCPDCPGSSRMMLNNNDMKFLLQMLKERKR